jgi:hypothetical protein
MTVNIENLLRNSSITNNIELDRVGHALIKNFIGTYSSDEVPMLKEKESCILNTKPKSSSGEHWVALKKYKNSIYFYDSYKRPYYELSKHWKTKKWIQPQVNAHPDESNYASNCGQLSLSSLYVFNKYGPKSWEHI